MYVAMWLCVSLQKIGFETAKDRLTPGSKIQVYSNKATVQVYSNKATVQVYSNSRNSWSYVQGVSKKSGIIKSLNLLFFALVLLSSKKNKLCLNKIDFVVVILSIIDFLSSK